MTPTPSGLIIQVQDGIQIVEFVDSDVLDQLRIEQMRGELDHLTESTGKPKIVMDFDNVNHISSAMLGVLMSLDKKVKTKGGELRLANIGANIRQVFSITKLDKLLRVYASVEEATRKF